MNSIVPTHFNAPTPGVSHLDIALCRLGAWLDAEQETLNRVLAQVGTWQAACVLESLAQLHLEPESGARELRDLLDEAQICLEILLDILSAIPSRCALQTAWGLPGPDAFDTHLRWSAARLEDILATLRRALAAGP